MGQKQMPKTAKSKITRHGMDKSSTISAGEVQPEESGQSIFSRRLMYRLILIVGVILVANIYHRLMLGDVTTLAGVGENISRRRWEVDCSSDYQEERQKYPDCFPTTCGRVVTDSLVSPEDALVLLRLAKAGLSYGGSSGGASILDLHSGALSKDTKFIDVYSVLKEKETFTKDDFAIYMKVRTKIQHAVASEFNVPATKLFLTSPTFFSRMNTRPSQTVHDEYWHVHVDKETYETFHYTSLLYLTDYGQDFTGGRFTFVGDGNNSTVEPKLARVSFFTSGKENPHFVEKVESGTRYALTVSFTCDRSKGISDPNVEEKRKKYHTGST